MTANERDPEADTLRVYAATNQALQEAHSALVRESADAIEGDGWQMRYLGLEADLATKQLREFRRPPEGPALDKVIAASKIAGLIVLHRFKRHGL